MEYALTLYSFLWYNRINFKNKEELVMASDRKEILRATFGSCMEDEIYSYIEHSIKKEKSRATLNLELVAKIYTYLYYGLEINSSVQYMSKLKAFLLEQVKNNDKKRWLKYVDSVFIPQEIYDLRNKISTDKVIAKLSSPQEIYDLNKIEEIIAEADKLIEDGYGLRGTSFDLNARICLLIFWCMLISGRRFIEVTKLVNIEKNESVGYIYTDLAKKRGDAGSCRAFIDDKEYDLLTKRLKEIRDNLDSQNQTNKEINNRIGRVFNRWLLGAFPDVFDNEETSHVLRKISMNRAWHKYGEGKMDKHFFCSTFLGHQIEIQAVDHYLA